MSEPAKLEVTVRSLVLEVAPEPDPAADAGTSLVNGLGFHSLALLELAYLLEDEFGLPPIDQETARGIATVGDVVDYVRAELAGRAGEDS